MPLYAYRCTKCRAHRTEVRPIERRNEVIPCGLCGGTTHRSISDEAVNTSNQEYDKPILSDAAGVAPSQVADHRKRHPNIPITDDGRVVFTSHAQRKNVLKELGLHDRNRFY